MKTNKEMLANMRAEQRLNEELRLSKEEMEVTKKELRWHFIIYVVILGLSMVLLNRGI